MPRPRQSLINIADTPYYHVTSRCVRRAYLCGYDEKSGVSFEHRKQWLEDRIRLLSSIFTIDLCAYAVMSNHYHMVVRLSPEQSNSWSVGEVLRRWCCLHKGTLLVRKYLQGESLSVAEHQTVVESANTYRDRLNSLSWFMKCLNEPIARMANREDGCTGHFWESRFSSQALLTRHALLACMVYVDLNPLRANLVSLPEDSDYTSIRERIREHTSKRLGSSKTRGSNTTLRRAFLFDIEIKPLVPFVDGAVSGKAEQPGPAKLPFRSEDYLTLLDRTSRIIRPDKVGSVYEEELPIIERLGVPPSVWLDCATDFERLYRSGRFRAPSRNYAWQHKH